MSGTSGIPNTQEGGTQSFRAGALKRRLKAIPLCQFSNTAEAADITSNTRFRLLLKGLTGILNVHIAVGIEGETGFIRASDIPAGGATMQLTPINNFPDVAKKMFLREVFQDPTATDNQNHPLAMDIPYGWEGATEADQVEIEVNVVVIDSGELNPWTNTNINGRLICEVAVEYNGSWWDVAAIQYALGQVTLEGSPDDLGIVVTSGGGE